MLLLADLKVSPSDLMLEELLSGLESPKAHWEPLKNALQNIPGRASHDRALQGVHGSHAEEQQAGTAGGTESISRDCSLPDEQALGGDLHLHAKGLPPSKAGVSGSSPLLGCTCVLGENAWTASLL